MAANDVMRVRLHLPGIRVLDVVIDEPDRLVVVVAVIRSWVRCWACGFKCRRVHQTTGVKIRDLPVSGRPTTLLWHRRRFGCERCGTTTTESCAVFDHKLTCRFAAALFAEVIDSTVNAVRRRHRLSWDLVMRVVAARAELLRARRRTQRVLVLGIDEKRILKGHGPFSTILTNAETGAVIDVIEGRSGATLAQWLQARSPRWRRSVRVVITDMAPCWRHTIAVELPNAAHVVDRFHVVRAAMAVLTAARRDAQRTPLGEQHDPKVFRARFLLARRCDRLTNHQIAELVELFDEHPHLAVAWELTQRFHRVFEADGWDAALAEVSDLADTMERTGIGFRNGVEALTRWGDEIANYHRHGRWTNNCAEGLNNRIETLERKAYGFTDPTNHAARIIAECPGHHRPNPPGATLHHRPDQPPHHALSR